MVCKSALKLKFLESNSIFLVGREPYFCTECSIGFQEKQVYYDHINNHFKVKFKGRKPTEKELKGRTPTNFGIQPISKRTCDVCKKVFNSMKDMRRHKLTVHEKVKRFFCRICGDGFFQNFVMMRHEKRHDERKFIDFSAPKSSKRGRKVKREYFCDFCEYKVETFQEIESHILAHLEERNKTFELRRNASVKIEKDFSKLQNLRDQQETDQGINETAKNVVVESIEFNCDLCDDTMESKESLETHLLQHQGDGLVQIKSEIEIEKETIVITNYYQPSDKELFEFCSFDIKSEVDS